jgi:hypothetical protein
MNNTIIVTRNSTTLTVDLPNGYDNRIPQNVTDAFTSGIAENNRTISSVFDIQWRTYGKTTDNDIGLNQTYLVGSYRTMRSMILDDAIEPVEGLIVDTQNGAIGFRNHTVPPSSKYGATWSEDILFIQPETECVDTNLTLDFAIPLNQYPSGVHNITLVDHGGFANFNKELPTYDYNDTQANPSLQQRAFFAATYNNIFSMLYLNVTNPKPDRFRYLDSYVGKGSYHSNRDGLHTVAN